MDRRVLLERDDDVARLAGSLHRARAGDGCIVVIEGAPGIGKTALVERAATSATGAGMQVLRACGDELEEAFAFGVVRQLFERPLARLSHDVRAEVLMGAASLATPLVDAAAPPHDVAANPYPLFHALYWLTANLAERGPVVLIVDDAHWSDTPSLRWLLYVARRLAGVAAAVVLASRTTAPEAPVDAVEELKASPDTVVIRPRPLSEPATGALLREVLRSPPAPELVSKVAAATGGNPFLLTEVARSLRADGIEPDAAAAERLQAVTPRSIIHSVLGRLALLPPEARELARAAAVLGEAAPLRLAAMLASLGDEAALVAVDHLVRAALVRSMDAPGNDQVTFGHPLIRQALYSDLAPGERASRHRQAARLLASDTGHSERAAAHLRQSPPAGDPWAVDVLRAAAASAMGRGDPQQASRHLRRALAEPPPPPARPQILLELGQAAVCCGESDALTHLEAAADAAAEPAHRAMALAAVSFARFMHNDPIGAVHCGREALHGLPPGAGGDAEAWLLASVAWAGRPVPGLVDGVVAMLDQPRVGPSGELTPAELIRVATQSHDTSLRGHQCDGIQRLAPLLEQAPGLLDSGSGVTGFTVGMALAFLGQDDTATATLERVVERGRQSGDQRLMGALDGLAYVCWRRGDLTASIAHTETALNVYAQGNGHAGGLPMTWPRVFQALCELERGDVAAAEHALDLPADIEARLPGTWWGLWVPYARAEVAFARREWATAHNKALEAGSQLLAIAAPSPDYMPWRSLAARAAAHLGDHEHALALATEELTLATNEGSPRSIGIALGAIGAIQGGGAGLDALAEAVAVLDGTRNRLEHARALCAYGSALRRANRRGDAREPLAASVESARRGGAIALVERAHQELRATGARPRRLAFTGVEALTPRERQVALLAAEGQSNPEIAQSLFVTRKTIETHMGTIFRKLGIDSRDQLPDVLDEKIREAP